MLLNLLLTALCGVSGVLLLEKWGVDNYMNTHSFWYRYWPATPCLLCRGFWIGAAVFTVLTVLPISVYLFVPLAAIPVQVLLTAIIQQNNVY